MDKAEKPLVVSIVLEIVHFWVKKNEPNQSAEKSMLWNKVECFRKSCFPPTEKLFPREEGSDFIFQQDNAPIDTAKITKIWFGKNSIKIHILERS